jgi:hypothetical protein
LKAHTSGVTKLQLLERQGILITAGKDKKLAVIYQLITINKMKISFINFHWNGEIKKLKLYFTENQ